MYNILYIYYIIYYIIHYIIYYPFSMLLYIYIAPDIHLEQIPTFQISHLEPLV